MQAKKNNLNSSSSSRRSNKDLDTLEEDNLLQRLSEGDNHAFWPLWQRYQKYLYYRCLYWMKDDAYEAEDALSLAMLKARHKLPNHAHKIVNFRAWLTRLTHNICMDKHRQARRKAIGVDNIDDLAGASLDAILASSTSPESALLSEELSQSVLQAINRLPERLRQPVVLRYYYQVSYPDIAQQLAVSQNNIYKRIQEARKKLKKYLSHYLSGKENCVLHSSRDEERDRTLVDKSHLSEGSSTNNVRCINPVISYHLTATCLVKSSHPLP